MRKGLLVRIIDRLPLDKLTFDFSVQFINDEVAPVREEIYRKLESFAIEGIFKNESISFLKESLLTETNPILVAMLHESIIDLENKEPS